MTLHAVEALRSFHERTIGELSRLSGATVRRLRFYSDRGLLPPLARTESGYRVYTDADVARLDLIRALRASGASLETIRKILTSQLSLADVLRTRLAALEAEIAAGRRIAAVLRATLRAPDPTETELRRLWTVTKLSQTQFRLKIERFYDRVAGDAPIDATWKQRMIEASTPDLPDDPTPEQIDAWTELTAMLDDEALIGEMRADMARMWTEDFDPTAYAAFSDAILVKVRAAMDRGLAPSSPTGAAIAREWLDQSAQAMRRTPDAAFLEWHRDQYRRHHATSARYQALLATLRGESPDAPPGKEWQWINEAMRPMLAEATA